MTSQEYILILVLAAVGLFLFLGKGDGFRPKIQRARSAAAKKPD